MLFLRTLPHHHALSPVRASPYLFQEVRIINGLILYRDAEPEVKQNIRLFVRIARLLAPNVEAGRYENAEQTEADGIAGAIGKVFRVKIYGHTIRRILEHT